MSKPGEFIRGTCQLRLFSPKGSIEGTLVKVNGAVVQLSMDPATGAAFARRTGPGRHLRALAVADHSPKTIDAAHPGFQFKSYADAEGHPIELPDADPGNVTIKGVVAALHFARHGQANGVMLQSGEFIHLGTRMLQAHTVNRITLA